MHRVDVVVVGLGAVGSAATYHLAKQGRRVCGFDSYHPPHSNGSSHGETRITRLAIGEGEEYTPLAMRSHELWTEIHRETGVDLLVACGGLIISNRSEAKQSHGVSGFLDNTVRAAQKYKIPHEQLSAADIRSRFPQFRVADHEEGYFEPSAGYLHVEACIEAQLKLAKDRYGAELHTDTPIATYRAGRDGVEVVTASGETYHADQLFVSAGAWLPKLVKLDPPYNDLFRVTRQVMHWFDVPAPRERFAPPAFPVFIWEPAGKAQPIYGFPLTSLDASSGVKIATEGKDVVDPDSVDRTEPNGTHRRDLPGVFRALLSRLPAALSQDQGLLLYGGGGWPLRDRSRARQRPGTLRVRLLRSRLQALGSARRSAGPDACYRSQRDRSQPLHPRQPARTADPRLTPMTLRARGPRRTTKLRSVRFTPEPVEAHMASTSRS